MFNFIKKTITVNGIANVGKVLALLVLILGISWTAAPDILAQELPVDLTKMSLEDLMNIEITSAGKKLQRLSDVPAAVHVISADDIRRSGVTTIAEALRLAPGLHVARIDANKWAVSSRGFSERFSNKLLVLIDGRSVYTPFFSGVYWSAQDIMIENVERIEVVRGPGAALWGANAVNGVINIITKEAWKTTGGQVAVVAGNEERSLVGVRYGAGREDGTSYRIYAKLADRDGLVDENDTDNEDAWSNYSAGFRMDSSLSPLNKFTLQGEFFSEDSTEKSITPDFNAPFSLLINSDVNASGGHLLGRWTQSKDLSNEMSLQFYYDRYKLDDTRIADTMDTLDIDFQHRFQLSSSQEILWGLGYRYLHNSFREPGTLAIPMVQMDPVDRNTDIISAFVQDEISLSESLRLTVGSKFEHNDFTGFESQPSVKVVWTPSDNKTIWAAVSKAVRMPSRIEQDGRTNIAVTPIPSLSLISFLGSENFESEVLWAHEAGFRYQPTSNVSIDLAGFYNDYEKLRSIEPTATFSENFPAPAHSVIASVADNNLAGQVYGLETAVQWQPMKTWKIMGAYSYLIMDIKPNDDSADTVSDPDGESPKNQISLVSSHNLGAKTELDIWARFVDELPNLDVDGYTNLDIRFGWKASENIELSLVGQNLLENHHQEFNADFGLVSLPTMIQRAFYVKLDWKF